MVRPQAIGISLTVKPAVGPGRILDLDTDLAFAGEAWSWVGDALPLVTTGSVLEPYELEHLMRAGFFTASDDTDSRERQCTDFEQEALHIATRLLCEVPVRISIRKGVDWPPFGKLIPMSTEHAVNTKIKSISALKQT